MSMTPGDCRQAGLNVYAVADPNRECHGCASVYSRAVDRGTMSLLKAFAVYAFAFAMAWLPGQAGVGSSVETATAQSCPLRSTTAAHSAFAPSRPPRPR